MRQQRVVVVFGLLLLGFIGVFVRLVRLQVVEHDLWAWETRRSTANFQSTPFERGWIFDRRGQPLALSEQAQDLRFHMRGWRRGTVSGQVALAWSTLTGERPPVAAALERAEVLVTGLGDVPVADVAALDERQRRLDFAFYVQRLFGRTVRDALVARVGAGGVEGELRLADLPGYEEGLDRARARAATERDALAVLARTLGQSLPDLHAELGRAVEAAFDRVDRFCEEGDGYRVRQKLHATLDEEPWQISPRLTYGVQTLVALRGTELAGFAVHTEQRRVYPPAVADVAPLLVGTVGNPSPDDVRNAHVHRTRLADLGALEDLTAAELAERERLRILVREIDYGYGEERGRLGVEAALERVLRGKRGWRATSAVDVDRQLVDEQPARRGLNVTLTLDVDLQRACQEVLDAVGREAPLPEDAPADLPHRWTGAIVLLDPRTGAIRAMASAPRPTRRELTDDYGALLHDPAVRLRHRALDPGASGNLPPPGSTFKPVAALAGLAHGAITATSTFHCQGGLDVGDRIMGCLGYHGDIDLKGALARSCNVYFYELGRVLGADPLRDAAFRFGFGLRSDVLRGHQVLEAIGLPVDDGVHEASPRLGPPPDTSTDAMRLAIGQHPLDDVTPLQVASMMGALGTGRLVPPSLVASVESYGELPSVAAQEVGAREEHLRQVREGLAEVLDSGSGSRLAELLGPDGWVAGQVAAKTGTAQVGGGLDHSWFAGYMPREDPRLAFAVLIEDCGLHGNEAALPVFARLLAKPAMIEVLRHEVLDLDPSAGWQR